MSAPKDTTLITCPICNQQLERRKAGPHKSVHIRQAKAKYIYKADGKQPYEYKTCPTCGETKLLATEKTFCSYRCSKMGALNPQWKGNNAGYLSFHGRVYRRLGVARKQVCSCGERADEWANQTGHYEDVSDYKAMCVPCHRAFDAKRRATYSNQ